MALDFTNMRSLLVIALLVAPLLVHAERFMGVLPGDRLTNLRALFPRAEFEELKPVWLKPHERLIQITGNSSNGIAGIVAFKLEHEVDALAAILRGVAEKQVNRIELSEMEAYALANWPERLARLRSNAPADPWEVDDIRWVPPDDLQIKTVIGKYGKPSSDELDEQFRRKVSWEKRGITAFVNKDDTINVIVFRFTIGDRFCASEWRASKECDPVTGPKRP